VQKKYLLIIICPQNYLNASRKPFSPNMFEIVFEPIWTKTVHTTKAQNTIWDSYQENDTK
jgi:hypothetical protein